MLTNSFFRKVAALLFGAVFVISCDTDFNSIGTDIVGDDHFGVEPTAYDLIATNLKTGAVQSNNLPINPLGVFNNGAFGKTTANFATQVELKVVNPTFKDVPADKIKSVVLNIPYFSTLLSTDSEGASTYELDSIYGDISKKIKLKVYENGYFMRDLDPDGGFQNAQKFYSDQNDAFNAAKGQLLNDDADASQNDAFVFSASQLVTPGATEDDDDVRAAPGMRLNLNKQFFYNKIFTTASTNLVNNNAFKNHLKGLYFTAEEVDGSVMNLMNFAQGTITVTYEDRKVTYVDGGEVLGDYEEKSLVLSLTGNTVSLLQHTATPESQAYENFSDPENIYLKGGDGAVTFIDLFGGGNSSELEELREQAAANNWIVNEANIVFTVDDAESPTSAMLNTLDANRIYLYNARNNIPLVDYYYDTSTYASKPKFSKVVHGGIGELTGTAGDVGRRVKKYKIRITEHIKNVIFKDSTNVRLGLAVTENISLVTTGSLKTPTSTISKVPFSSVMNPTGVVLYGPQVNPANESKRLKLEIYYTKPN